MIILITGVPGSGKTLYGVHLLKEYMRANQKLVEVGETPRDLYADVDGLQLSGVLPAPEDWREAPDGSVLVYDECQQRMGPDGAGRSSRPDIQELEVHRHRGIDIILITQHPKLLHAHVRRLIGRHYHLFRMFGAETAKVFRADRSMDVDKAASLNREDMTLWPYPKSLYGEYKSATVHTHRRQLPAWLKRSFVAMVVMAVVAGVLIYSSKGFWLAGTSEPPAGDTFVWDTEPLEVAAQPLAEASPTEIPAACIWSSSRCLCYDADGRRILREVQTCIDTASGPWERLPTSYATGHSYRPRHIPPSVAASGSEHHGGGFPF